MKLKLSEKRAELIVDAVVAALLSLSFALSFFHIRGYEVNFYQTLLSTAMVTLLVALLSRRWWLTPLLLFAVFVSGAWFVWQAEAWEPLLEISQDFIVWANQYWWTGGPESNWLFLLVPLLLLLPVIAAFVLVRFMHHLLVYLLLIAAAYVPLLIWYPDTFSNFLIALSALLILMPRHFSHLMQKKRPQDTRLPRSSMQLLAIPIAIISLLSAQLIVPDNTADWRYMPFVRRVQDIEDVWQNTFGGGRYWQGFDIGDYGYTGTGQRMGGPVTLSSDRVLRVETDTPALMRGITRTYYTGYSWNRPSRQHFRFGSPLWTQIRRQSFNAHYPAGRQEASFRDRFVKEVDLVVDHQVRLSTLFTTGRVTDIETEDMLNQPPYFTEDGDLFVYSPLPQRQPYTQTVQYFDRNQEGFDNAIKALEQRMKNSTDRNLPRVQAMYLQLPESLPDEVFNEAEQITESTDSPYEQAVLLESWLRDNGTYSLTPEVPPEDEDFVAHFLETRTGYCVYYASAMVVMARTLDIPARYVEGFILEADTRDDYYYASGEQAHAWAELYFTGIGWLTFDATPPAEIPDDEDPDDLPPEVITPEPTPSPDLGPDFEFPEDEEPDSISHVIVLSVLAGLVALFMLIRLMIWLARYRHNQRFIPENVHLKRPDRRARLTYYYEDILRQLTCISIRPEDGETLQQFAERAEASLKIALHPVPEVFWAVARLRYGKYEPHDEEILRAAQLHQKIEAHIKSIMPTMTYFIRRVLLAVKP